MRRPVVLLAGVIAALGLGVTTTAAALRLPARAATRRVGSLTLHRCADGSPGYCGSIPRALDPGLRGGPRIRIGFEWIPARERRSPVSTIVAVEGGPGYPSSGSDEEYSGTFRGVMSDHDLLMVDNRGTGRSALIRCPSLDRYPLDGPAEGARFDTLVGDCAAHLDHLYRAPDGRFIHAADLFSTEDAVSDLHAVLGALRTGRVTLYGDSYGSWFAQAFMARYPRSLRAVVLDSTYGIHRLDPVYASSGSSARAAMDGVCERSATCRADAGPGTPVSRLARLLTRLRRAPIRGTVAVLGGGRQVAVTPRTLVDLVQNGGSDPYVWRELDASIRAALAGDDAPLERLALYDEDDGGSADPGYFSDGDYMAVGCSDYPQLFGAAGSPARRRRELAARVRDIPRGAFAPFTAREWVTMSGYSETYDSCLDWPRAVHPAPVVAPVGARALPAAVPLLVIGGDLDDLTPLRDVRRFAHRLGADVRVVDLRNTVHVTSEGDTTLTDGTTCARTVIDRFVADPGGLDDLDARCAATIPALQTPDYPASLAAAPPAATIGGPAVDRRVAEAVTVAAGALADVTIRCATLGGDRGVGLYGGGWRGSARRIRLTDVRFVPDATVSGVAAYRPGAGGRVTRGRLVVVAHGLRVAVTLSWDERSQTARARVGATRLSLPAP